jgi:filamentous hemagglutinin
MADTPANRAEVERLFNQAFRDPATISGSGRAPGSNMREFFLPGITGTGSKIQFVELNGEVITIMAK